MGANSNGYGHSDVVFSDRTGFTIIPARQRSCTGSYRRTPTSGSAFAHREAGHPQDAAGGTVAFLSGKALEERFVVDRPWVFDPKKAAPAEPADHRDGRAHHGDCRIARSKAYFRTMEHNMRKDSTPRGKF